jgi:hypothetical protein
MLRAFIVIIAKIFIEKTQLSILASFFFNIFSSINFYSIFYLHLIIILCEKKCERNRERKRMRKKKRRREIKIYRRK